MAKRVKLESETSLVQRCANKKCKAIISAFLTVCPYCKTQVNIEN